MGQNLDCCRGGPNPGGGSVVETGLMTLDNEPERRPRRRPRYDEDEEYESPRKYTKAYVGKPAPEFEASAWFNGFKRIKLADYRGKYVLLFFWPMDFTFVCPTEIIQFSDKAKDFRAIGCEVLGASIDTQFVHMEYTKKDRKLGGLGKMDIPMISDVDKKISKMYGCLIDEGKDAGVALRATYIIDDKGVIRHISINDLPVGRNIDESLRLVQAFQYTDKYGEVCPAQWNPGDATMKPDDDKQLAAFWQNQ